MMDLTTPLRGLPLAVIDTETTGLDPATCHVVEVAVVHLELGAEEPPRVAFSARVRPHAPGTDDPWPSIPEQVSRIHGITDADVADCPTWAEVGPQVLEALAGRVPVAHNAPFDFRFVRAECERFGQVAPAWPWLCTQVPAKVVDKYERGKRLADIAARRGIVLDAHGAAGDAMTAALVASGLWRSALRETCDLTGYPSTLGNLFDWQRTQALEQEADFCAYLQRRGARGPRPDCHWHEIEGEPLPYWPEPTTPTAPCTRCGRPVTTAIGKGGQIESRDELGAHDCEESRLDPQPRTPGLFP